MSRVARAGPVALLAIGVACAPEPGPREPDPRAVRSSAERIALAVQSGAAAPACGTRTPAATPQGWLLLVNARQCLSCRGMGHALRQLGRELPPGSVALVAPASEMDALCPFIREERVTLEVLALPERIFPPEALGNALVVVGLARRGNEHLVMTAGTADELVAALRADAVEGPP